MTQSFCILPWARQLPVMGKGNTILVVLPHISIVWPSGFGGRSSHQRCPDSAPSPLATSPPPETTWLPVSRPVRGGRGPPQYHWGAARERSSGPWPLRGRRGGLGTAVFISLRAEWERGTQGLLCRGGRTPSACNASRVWWCVQHSECCKLLFCMSAIVFTKWI